MKVEAFGKALTNGLDCFLVTNSKNLFYFTGFSGSGVLLVPREGKAFLYIPEMEFEAAKARAVGCDLQPLKRNAKIWDILTKELKSRNAVKVGVDDLMISQYAELTKRNHGVGFLPKM